jgi:hypothetical protein
MDRPPWIWSLPQIRRSGLSSESTRLKLVSLPQTSCAVCWIPTLARSETDRLYFVDDDDDDTGSGSGSGSDED